MTSRNARRTFLSGTRGALVAAVAGGFLAFAPAPVAAQAVGLGTAADFGVLGGSAVTNTGPTIVNGSVGVWPGTSITGFPPGTIAPGTGVLRSADAVAQQAQSDLTTAYLDAAGRAWNRIHRINDEQQRIHPF